MISGVDRALVCVGGPGANCLLSRPTPLPASGLSGAIACCCPKTDAGNPQDVVSFATQPMVGTVSAVLTPCSRFSSRNVSHVGGPLESPTFLKNQSLVRFHVFNCQL